MGQRKAVACGDMAPPNNAQVTQLERPDTPDVNPHREGDWYVIQVTRSREETMANLIGRLVPEKIAGEVFYPQFETEIKYRGVWLKVNKPLFPGYLISITDHPADLSSALRRMPEFARLLLMDGMPVPMADEEVALIGGFTTKGKRVVPMSQAVKEGDTVVITAGPLLGHEGLIREVNRHKSTAYLEIDLCGRKVSTRVGLAIVSAGDSRAAKSAERKARMASEGSSN